MFGAQGPLVFYLNFFCCPVYVSKGACILKDGKRFPGSGDCSLREVLQEVGFGDQVDLCTHAACEQQRQTLPPKKTVS